MKNKNNWRGKEAKVKYGVFDHTPAFLIRASITHDLNCILQAMMNCMSFIIAAIAFSVLGISTMGKNVLLSLNFFGVSLFFLLISWHFKKKAWKVSEDRFNEERMELR